MAAITSLALRSPVILCPSSASNPRIHGINRKSAVNLFSLAKPYPSLSIRNPKSIRITASASPSPSTPITPVEKFTAQSSSTLTGPTRSLATLAALATVLVKVLSQKFSFAIQTSSPGIADALRSSLSTTGPVFFAAARYSGSGSLNTPLAVVARGVQKWLEIYCGVLLVRVLLSWFPNIPWERQPLSAIRELSDPYLSIFRGMIPPVFGALDISPLFAFAILGFLSNLVGGGQ